MCDIVELAMHESLPGLSNPSDHASVVLGQLIHVHQYKNTVGLIN